MISGWRILGTLLGILLFILMFAAVYGNGEQTVKTIEYPIGYVAQSIALQFYGKNVTFDPPDGVQQIESAEITLTGDFQAGTRVYARIGNQDCNPEYWQIPNKDVTNYMVTFDCSELLADATTGTQEVRFLTNEVAQNLYARYKITYYNHPEGTMNIFGTEYNIGEQGSIWLQLKDENGEPVNNGICYVDAYYPNMPNQTHPLWLNYSPMLYLNNSDGIYFYDFTLGNISGVYFINALCSYSFNYTFYYTGTAKEPIRTDIQGTWTGNPVALNSFTDNAYTKCVSGGGATKYCEASYDWVVDDTNISSLDFFWMGESNVDLTFNMYVYNWTGSSWYHIGVGTIVGTGSTIPTGINSFFSVNIPDLDDMIAPNNTVTLRGVASSGSVFNVFNNWLSLRASQTGSSIQDVKGSGEIHISDRFSNISVQLANQTELIGSIWNYSNKTVSSSWDEARFVGGTEYSSGEEGKAATQLLTIVAGNPTPITTANCTIDIYYPNNTLFISGGQASFVSGSDGLYDYNFTVPSTLGIYKEEFSCTSGVKTYYASGTFHVAGWANSIFQINSSISTALGYLMEINGTLHYINSTQYQQFLSIQGKLDSLNSSIYNLSIQISGVNQSIMSKLYMLQDDIAQINTTLNQMNSSLTQINANIILINSTLQDMNDSLTQIISLINGINLTEVKDLISQMNQSLSNQISIVQSDISSLSSQLSGVNASIMGKLYMIQDDLASINQTILSSNQSIMGKLYMIQDDIDNLLNNLTVQLANVTNFTMNITADLDKVAIDVWTLFFKRGTPPLAPSTEYFCLDNDTLIKQINYTFQENSNTDYYVKNEEILCEYGCDIANSVCYLPPYQRYVIVAGISFIIFIFALILWRKTR